MKTTVTTLANEVVSLLAENCETCQFRHGCELDVCPLIRLYDIAAQVLEDYDETR